MSPRSAVFGPDCDPVGSNMDLGLAVLELALTGRAIMMTIAVVVEEGVISLNKRGHSFTEGKTVAGRRGGGKS